MSAERIVLLLLLSAVTACNDDADQTPHDGGADASMSATDMGVDASLDAAPVAPDASQDMSAGACGTETLPTSIRGTEGIAIAADGTIYYSQEEAIGRRRPGMAPENNWVAISHASTIWGLALRDDGVLYALAPSLHSIYRIDTTASSPSATALHTGTGSCNGATIGPDDVLYYSNFGDGHVYRLTDDGTKTRVTASAITQANGLLFDDDGTLLVLSYATGEIFRLTLDASTHMETARETAGGVEANPDGIAKDSTGRFYISDNSGGIVYRTTSTFEDPEVILSGVNAAANIVFGRGALSCTDIYVASSGALARASVDDTGRP